MIRSKLPERLRHWALPLGLLALAAVPYRGLLALDPSGGRRRPLEGTEGLLFEPSASSPLLLIFAVALWLVWRRWPAVRAALGAAPNVLATLGFLVPSIALCIWANYIAVPALLIPALSLGALSAASWLGGTVLLRQLWLPGVFLLFAMPTPTPLVNHVMYPLQLATADGVSWTLGTVGLPVSSHGDLIFYGGTVFQVIESCSGLRSTLTMVMASLVYQELFFRSRLQSLILVLGSPLIGLLANQVRVLSIVLSPQSHYAAVHTAQGIVTIVVGVLVLAGLDTLLTRLLPRPEPREAAARAASHVSGIRVATCAGVAGALTAATLLLAPWDPPRPQYTPLYTLPATLGDWTASGLKLDQKFLGSVSFTEWIHRTYVRQDERVAVFLGADSRLDPSIGLLSLKTALPGTGWVIADHAVVSLDGDGASAESFLASSPNSRALSYRWYYGIESSWVETLRALLVLDRGPLRRRERAVVVRLTTVVEAAPGARGRAEARLQELATLLRPELAGIARPGQEL